MVIRNERDIIFSPINKIRFNTHTHTHAGEWRCECETERNREKETWKIRTMGKWRSKETWNVQKGYMFLRFPFYSIYFIFFFLSGYLFRLNMCACVYWCWSSYWFVLILGCMFGFIASEQPINANDTHMNEETFEGDLYLRAYTRRTRRTLLWSETRGKKSKRKVSLYGWQLACRTQL